MIRECRTQDELNKALEDKKKHPSLEIWLVGDGEFTASGSAHVTAFDSAHVTASGSAHVRASGSAHVRAFGSAHVRAFGSAHVTAFDSAHVTASGSAHVRASNFVGVTVHGDNVKTKGGQIIQVPRLDTPELWCEFYGLEVVDGVVTLFKALNEDFTSPNRTSYKPGSIPEAKDWDGGKEECGGGLHFSPRPFMTLAFHAEATRFAACPVRLSDMAVHPDGMYPEKVKAKGCCAPVWEVDIDGEKVE